MFVRRSWCVCVCSVMCVCVMCCERIIGFWWGGGEYFFFLDRQWVRSR